MTYSLTIDPLPEPDTHPVAAVDDIASGGEAQDIQQTHDAGQDRPQYPHDDAIHESPPRIIVRKGNIEWAKKRGGPAKNKTSVKSRVEAPDVKSQGAIPGEQNTPSDGARVVGAMAAGAFLSICELLGGPEFAPEAGESDALTTAAGAYCAAEGYSDLPPGIALCMVASIFIAKRWNMPVFAEKRKNWMKKIGKDEISDANK